MWKKIGGLLLTATLVSTATAADPSTRPVTRPAVVEPEIDASIPTFMAGIKDSPVTTRYGGRRGQNADVGVITMVAPVRGGVAATVTPVVYYFFSAPTDKTVEVAVTKDGDIDPVYEITLAGATAGLHRIDLAAAGKPLDSGAVYEVVVAVVTDPDHRSRDAVCSTTIRCVLPTPAESARLATGPASGYLAAGDWYDGFDAVTRAIEADPANLRLRWWRGRLLNGPAVKLPEVAAGG